MVSNRMKALAGKDVYIAEQKDTIPNLRIEHYEVLQFLKGALVDEKFNPSTIKLLESTQNQEAIKVTYFTESGQERYAVISPKIMVRGIYANVVWLLSAESENKENLDRLA